MKQIIKFELTREEWDKISDVMEIIRTVCDSCSCDGCPLQNCCNTFSSTPDLPAALGQIFKTFEVEE